MTKFEDFAASFKRNPESFRAQMQESQTYDFVKQVKKMQKVQNNLSGFIMVDLFGEQLGMHLWEKFAIEANRNLLRFLNLLGTEEHFFLMHEINAGRTYFSG